MDIHGTAALVTGGGRLGVAPDTLAKILFTSGSTGNPKVKRNLHLCPLSYD